MDFWPDVIKVIGSIIVSMAVCFTVYYFFFRPLLKKPKEQTDSLEDILRSTRLCAQENHNAVIQTNIQTSHDVRESLSKEHLEIKQNLSATRDEIKSLSQEIDSLKQQIDFLISRDIEITNSIIGLVSSFEKVMKEANYTNQNLSAEVKSLTAENQKLKAEISLLKHQIEVQSCTINYPTHNMHL